MKAVKTQQILIQNHFMYLAHWTHIEPINNITLITTTLTIMRKLQRRRQRVHLHGELIIFTLLSIHIISNTHQFKQKNILTFPSGKAIYFIILQIILRKMCSFALFNKISFKLCYRLSRILIVTVQKTRWSKRNSFNRSI